MTLVPKPALLSVLILLLAAEGPRAQGDIMGQLLQRSAVVEWVFANCDADELDAGHLMAAQAALAGAPQPLASMARAFVEDGAASHYASQNEACADMRRAVPDTP